MNINAYSSEEQHVLETEDAYIAAEINRDGDVLRRIIDHRFVLNSNSGKTSGKAELIDSVLSWKMTGQTISERSVLVEGALAIVFGTTELRFASEDQGETKSLLRYTSTYIKRQGEWRMIALHMAKRHAQE